ncbi:SRPBCC family protein [Devosia sp. CAU 1758]
MSLSHTIVVQIAVPVASVRAYMADPRNYAEWAAVYPETYRQLDTGDWTAEVRFGGVRHIRFSAPNEDGILDHAVFRPGEEPVWMPMRAVPDEQGTELSFTFIQRPDMSQEAFRSTIEWITTDLLVLKTVLETRYPSSRS